MGAAYYLRRELREQVTQCIVEGCRMTPKRWSCLCNCHFMRWRQNGSFEKSRCELRREEHERYWVQRQAA